MGNSSRSRRHSERGTTLIALLLVLTVIGVATSIVARSWAHRIRRENEEELLFRGVAIRSALESYARATPAGGAPRPRDLKDLLDDDRFAARVHHLRAIYRDPLTGTDFVVLRDANGRIAGVASADPRAPLKRTGFPTGLESFERAKSYRDWVFRARTQEEP